MCVKDAPKVLEEGAVAPNFSFTDENGGTWELINTIKRNRAVVYFYPRDFTPGCTLEAHDFTLHYKKFEESGINIIGVSPDDEESHRKFREKMKIPYGLAADPQNIISRNYGVYGPKKFMGKEYIGVNRSTFLIGNNGKILKVFNKVKPAGHAMEVLASLKVAI